MFGLAWLPRRPKLATSGPRSGSRQVMKARRGPDAALTWTTWRASQPKLATSGPRSSSRHVLNAKRGPDFAHAALECRPLCSVGVQFCPRFAIRGPSHAMVMLIRRQARPSLPRHAQVKAKSRSSPPDPTPGALTWHSLWGPVAP